MVKRLVMATVTVTLVVWTRAAVEARRPAAPPPTGQETIYVWKAKRLMELRDGNRVLRRFEISLGLDPAARKRFRGDNRTPVGRYFISDKRPRSRFHRFLGLSYPNINDAERGYASRLIDANQWADIFLANLRGRTPPWSTPLGGRVGIHGHGGRPELGIDWTEGCIAVSDREIEYLYDRVGIGTPVIIFE